MSNSLENRMVARIEHSAGNGCPVAEAVRVVTAPVLTNSCSDEMSAEVEGLASDDPAIMAALGHAGSISHLVLTTAGTNSSSFPMTGAGLANIRNEL